MKTNVSSVAIALVFFSLGFSSTIRQDEELDQWLNLAIDTLINVEVVSATKNKQYQRTVPATVHVIHAEQIQQRGYQTLEDVLADLPGFQFRNINGFNTYSFMRGAPSQNNLILVLIDGVQINELNSGGFYGGMQYNLINTKRIEVVYGPSSVLYGTNAISGIINIITYDPAEVTNSAVHGTTGSFNTYGIDLQTGRFNKKNRLGFSVSGMVKQSDKADLRGYKGDYNWSDNMENFEYVMAADGKMTFHDFTFGALVQDKQASRTTNYKSEESSYLDYGSKWHIRFVNTYLAHHQEFTSCPLRLLSRLYYRNATIADNTVAYVSTDTSLGQVRYYRPNDLSGIEEVLTYTPLKKITVTGGINLEYERLAESFSETFSGDPDVEAASPSQPHREHNKLASGFLQLQAQPLPWISLSAGIRLDYSTVYDIIQTPRAAIVINYQHFTGKALYAEAFRAPKPWDYSWGNGNASLQPEKMRAVEGAFTYKLEKFLSLDLSIYRNIIYDKLLQDQNRYCWTNSEELNCDGIETGVTFILPLVQAYLNYSFNQSTDAHGQKVDEIADHCFNQGITLQPTRHCSITLRGNYVGKRSNPQMITATGTNEIDAYYCLNGNVSLFLLSGYDMQFTVNNIFNTKYYHTSNRPPERYRQPQRAFIIKIGCRF